MTALYYGTATPVGGSRSLATGVHLCRLVTDDGESRTALVVTHRVSKGRADAETVFEWTAEEFEEEAKAAFADTPAP